MLSTRKQAVDDFLLRRNHLAISYLWRPCETWGGPPVPASTQLLDPGRAACIQAVDPLQALPLGKAQPQLVEEPAIEAVRAQRQGRALHFH